jgi:hypothetical protein
MQPNPTSVTDDETIDTTCTEKDLLGFICAVLNELTVENIQTLLTGACLSKRHIELLIKESDIENFTTWERIDTIITELQSKAIRALSVRDISSSTKRKKQTYTTATRETLRSLSLSQLVRCFDLNFHEAQLVKQLYETGHENLLPPRIAYEIQLTKANFDSQEPTTFHYPLSPQIGQYRVLSFNMLNFGEKNADRKDHDRKYHSNCKYSYVIRSAFRKAH